MTYIHSDNKCIGEFIGNHVYDKSDIKAICEALFKWFDENVEYGRLNAPFFPLQRSDLDVLSMRSGTCGDYSNLIVSVLQRLDYEVMYAYVHRDCYGDEQDHICAAVREGTEWILIDATQPYRKWHGFACPHREYELLSPDAFEEKMKIEEAYWIDVAKRYGNELYAGLFYAPWLHEEILRESETVFESIFYLLSIDAQKNATLYAYYKRYTKENGSIPMMGMISKTSSQYCFSCKPHETIWDNGQFSQAYSAGDIPREFQTDAWREFQKRVAETVIKVDAILRELDCSLSIKV